MLETIAWEEPVLDRRLAGARQVASSCDALCPGSPLRPPGGTAGSPCHCHELRAPDARRRRPPAGPPAGTSARWRSAATHGRSAAACRAEYCPSRPSCAQSPSTASCRPRGPRPGRQSAGRP
eukprot:9261412-Pyramimonas_sp.AAC.1